MIDWGLGSYERIAKQLLPAAEMVVETADPVPGETLVDIGCGTGNAALQSDKIRPLAVTSMARARKYPNLATLDELGVKGYEVNTWMAFFAPAGVPKDVAASIEAAIKEAVAMPDVRARFEATGAEMRSGTASELRTLLATDVAKWSKLVKEKNIKFGQ